MPLSEKRLAIGRKVNALRAQNYSNEQIAEQLGIDASYVRSLASQTRKHDLQNPITTEPAAPVETSTPVMQVQKRKKNGRGNFLHLIGELPKRTSPTTSDERARRKAYEAQHAEKLKGLIGITRR